MPVFNFPASPAINDTYTPSPGITYVWDGTTWLRVGSVDPVVPPKVLIKRTSTPNAPPVGLVPGELSVEMSSPTRLWVGVPTIESANGRKLLSSTILIGDMPPPNPTHGLMWWESDAGILWVYYDDGTSVQWVQAAGGVSGGAGGSMADYVLKIGDAMTGDLTTTGIFSAMTGMRFAGEGFPNFAAYKAGAKINYAFDVNCGWQFDETTRRASLVVDGFESIGAAGAAVTLAPQVSVGAGDSNSIVFLDKGVNLSAGFISRAATSHVSRWWIKFGDETPEGGAAGGCNLTIHGYDNNGQVIMGGASMFTIFRTDGWITHQGSRFQTTVQGIQPGGGVWGDSSDSRIKTVTGDYTQGLAAIKQLNPVRYEFKGNVALREPVAGQKNMAAHEDVLGKEYVGLVAQAAEVPMPELVTQETGWINGQRVDDLRMLNASALTYALINAVKELSAANDALTARVAALEGATRK